MATGMTWYKFYFSDWNNDETVKALTTEQIGAYWMLLVHQMGEGSIPANTKLLAAFVRAPVAHFETELWPAFSHKFVELEGKEGRLHNLKCTAVMQEDAARRQTYSIAANKRWQGARQDGAPAPAPSLRVVDEPEQEADEEDTNLHPLVAAFQAGAGELLVGKLTPTRSQLQALGKYDAKTLKLLGEHVAARLHWAQLREPNNVAFTLERLVKADLQSAVINAKAWDKAGRTTSTSKTGMIEPIGPQPETRKVDL
jgi:uncharacterized protein YdaU (DUF1376 family)